MLVDVSWVKVIVTRAASMTVNNIMASVCWGKFKAEIDWVL